VESCCTYVYLQVMEPLVELLAVTSWPLYGVGFAAKRSLLPFLL
jgi:hypothetical protein